MPPVASETNFLDPLVWPMEVKSGAANYAYVQCVYY